MTETFSLKVTEGVVGRSEADVVDATVEDDDATSCGDVDDPVDELDDVASEAAAMECSTICSELTAVRVVPSSSIVAVMDVETHACCTSTVVLDDLIDIVEVEMLLE